MADDARAAPVSETGSFGAGAGGKLRTKRSHRRSATPYERPPLSRLRSSSDVVPAAADGPNDGAGSWFSKLVTRPASKILFGASSRLFSSVFGKREPALPAPPVEEIDEEDEHDTPSETYNVLPDRQTDGIGSNKVIQPEVVDKGTSSFEHAKGSDPNWVTEVEQFLTQKTISRDEFNHLSKFLQSRTIGLSEVGAMKSETAAAMRHEDSCKVNNMNSEDEREKTLRTRHVTEPPSENATTIKEPFNANNAILISTDERQNTPWNNHMTGNSSNFTVSSNVHDDNRASPLEIAKAYMSRTSIYGPVSRIKERTMVASNSFTPKLSRFSLAPKSPACLPGTDRQEVHNYFTPSSRRSRIRLHNMVKSPYSGSGYRAANEKVTAPGSVQWKHSDTLINFSKKRSPLVDDIFSSGGPVRRVRAKSVSTNPGFLSTNSIPPFPSSYADKNNTGENSMTSSKKIAVESNIFSFPKDGEKEKASVLPTCIPSESSDIGAKISKHLDKMFQSSKDKKVEIIASKTGEASNNEKNQLSGLDAASVHSESLREVAKVPNSTWKSGTQLHIVPPLPQVHGRFGSGNASILVPEPVTRDLGSNCSDQKFGSGNAALKVHSHSVENIMPEIPLKENEDHKDRHISGQESAVTKTEEQRSLPFSFGKSGSTEAACDRADEKLSSSSNDGSGFTFPVPMTTLLCETPQTPSVSPSAAVPSFSFGVNGGGKNLVFSFSLDSTEDANTTTPQFTFDAANKTNVSFSSAVASLPALPSSHVTMSPQDRNGSANGVGGSSQTLLPTFSNVNQGRSVLDSGSSAAPSSFSNTYQNTSSPPKFSSSAFASGSASSSTQPTSTTFSSLVETKPTFSFSNPFISGGSSAPAFSFSSINHKQNASALDFRANGSSQTGQGMDDTLDSNPSPVSLNAQACFAPSSSALGNFTASSSAAPIFQFSSPKPDFGQVLSQDTTAAASVSGDKSSRRFIKINRDRLKRR